MAAATVDTINAASPMGSKKNGFGGNKNDDQRERENEERARRIAETR